VLARKVSLALPVPLDPLARKVSLARL